MNPWFEKRLASRMNIVRIVWIALMATIGVYGFLIANTPLNHDLDWNSVLANPNFLTFAFASCFSLALSFALPAIFRKTAAKRVMDKPWTEDVLRAAKTSKGYRLYRDEDIPQLLTLQGQEILLERIFQVYYTSKIVRWALSESVAIFGFLLGFTMHSLLPFFPFAAVGLLSMAVSGPSVRDLRQYAGLS